MGRSTGGWGLGSQFGDEQGSTVMWNTNCGTRMPLGLVKYAASHNSHADVGRCVKPRLKLPVGKRRVSKTGPLQDCWCTAAESASLLLSLG